MGRISTRPSIRAQKIPLDSLAPAWHPLGPGTCVTRWSSHHGYVAAGRPIFPGESLKGYLEINRLLEDRSNQFVLQVKGDSIMVWQISQSDDVLVRAQPWVQREVVCVIMTDTGAMVNPVAAHWPMAGARQSAAAA